MHRLPGPRLGAALGAAGGAAAAAFHRTATSDGGEHAPVFGRGAGRFAPQLAAGGASAAADPDVAWLTAAEQ